ncbi:DUF5916 domain-containing protein, partial [Acidobacteriota bacterium]
MMFRKALVFLLAILSSSGLILAQFEKFKISAVKTTTPPVIDGIVGEKEWKSAPIAGDFIQFVPNKGAPASVKTTVKILYDNDFIYFGILCEDPEPEKIQLGTNRRDSLSSTTGTDSITVELDTFNDDRSAYYYRTNPLGVQFDGRATDNGRVADNDWDGIWKSAGSMTAEGWSAEIVIPFKHIRYEPGKNQTWGIQFSRYFPRNLEKSFWTGPLEDYRKVSINGSLTGLDIQKSPKNWKAIPHIISKLQENKKADFEAGLDASYALSQSISGYLTVNPDFATVEADQEKVNLTRFELNLPEKRNFFLEGNDIYQQKIRLFYSRRIADIYGGVKIHGKTGAYELSALSAQTREEDEEGDSANFSVFRLKRDILKSSNIGFLIANKLVKGVNQGTFGLDASLYFTKTFSFTGQVAMSYGEGNESDLAFFLRPSYDSRTFHIHIRYTHLGDNFGDNANAVGFIRDDNRHEFDSA